MDKKIFSLVAVAVLLAGTLIWSAFWVQLEKIRELSDNIQKEQLDSQVREERSQKIYEMGKELGDVENSQKEMNALFVDKENAVPFLKMLESFAESTGNSIRINVADLTKIQSKTTKKPAVQESEAESTKDLQKEEQTQKVAKPQNIKQDFSNQLGFSLELTGRFQSLVDFLTKLENLPYFVRIYNFQISPVAKNLSIQTSGSSVPSESESQSTNPGEENKNIKTNLIIGVYTNGGK